jgi:hypothetical protein
VLKQSRGDTARGQKVHSKIVRVAIAASFAVLAGCNSSAQAPAQCAAGESICDGVCANLQTSKDHCGGCGVACAAPANGGTATCAAGICQPACAAPLGLCNARADAGVSGLACTDTSLDPVNCGGCGNVCAPQQACTAGQCTSCPSGQLQCPTDTAGRTACTPVLSDNLNCGGCGVICDSGTSCQQGACVAAGLSNCGNADGGPAQQKDLASDPQNCGACGRACSANEVCKNGGCDPCPVAACSNACVDTQHDPANCGACGVTAPFCDNGTALTQITIEVVAPLSLTAASSFVTALGTNMPFTVKVHSGLRTVRVTLKTAANIGALAGAAITDLAPVGPVELSTTTWGGSIPVPGSGSNMAIEIDAFDEQYLASQADAGFSLAHTDSKQFTANITAVPVAAPTNITASVGGSAVGAGAACGAAPCMWVPLNAGPITLSAQVTGAPANGVAAIEFHNANSPGSNTSLLCPSRAPAVPGAPAVPCAQPVNGSGIATLTLNAADVGEGDVTIFACPVDVTGLQTGGCAPMPILNICGAGGTTACAGNFTVGRLAACPTSATCAMPVPPVVGRNVDTPANHTLYYMNLASPTLPVLFAQDAVSLSKNPKDQPGAQVGANTYVFDGLFATAEGSGVYAIRCTGTCNGTPTAGNTAIDRVDCPATANPACYKQNFVTTGGQAIRQIHVATSQAMLISNAPPPASNTGAAFFANALQSQTTALAVQAGTLQSVTINGASTGVNWGTMTNGAIVAVFNGQPAIYHPNLPGNHMALLPNTADASVGNFDLVVFPSGEIVYQYTSDVNSHFLGAAYYDGTATPPKALAVPLNYGGSGTALAKNFVVAAPGILVGELPVSGSTVNFEAVAINLFPGSGTAPGTVIPIPFDGTTTGNFHEGGVFGRNGAAANFAISDDRTKAIFVTDDPPPVGRSPVIWRLHLFDLTAGSQVSLAGSERMLCAFTPTTALANCVPNALGAAHYPRFVHSAPPYVGGAATGLNQAVVWEEESRVQAGSIATRRARIWFATFSGGGAPAISSIDRMNVYNIAALSAATFEAESAAAGAIFFLTDNDGGGVDLYTAPLTPPASTPVVSTRVLDRVFGFKLREDKARMLVARADGTLYLAALAGGGANPAGGLVPVAANAIAGDTQAGTIGFLSVGYGFTPDGDHAFAVIDQQSYFGGTLGYSGIVETIDLTAAPYARTDWGRVSSGFLASLSAGFIANAGAAELVDWGSVENSSVAHFRVVTSANATSSVNTGMPAVDPTGLSATNDFDLSPSLDGSEGLVSYLNSFNAFSGNGTFLPLGAITGELPGPLATNSPFGGPYRPEYSQLNGTFLSGATSSLFKDWGSAPPASTPSPFVTLSRGFPAASSLPVQTRQTPDNKELLYSFGNGQDGSGSYAIFLPLSGRAPPAPLLP